MEANLNQVHFLDITVFKHFSEQNCTLQTRTYFKPTDTHALLHSDSYHPLHTFNSVIKSQILRFKRNSSFKVDFDTSCKILFFHLKNRGYSYRRLKQIKNKVWFDNKTLHTHNTPVNQNKPIPPPVFPLIFDFNSYTRQLIPQYKDILKDYQFLNRFRFVTAYKKNPTLGNKLVRSKFI